MKKKLLKRVMCLSLISLMLLVPQQANAIFSALMSEIK